jgi:hypothetical protein
MNKVNFALVVTGHYFNHWPYLKICHNGQEIFNDQIVNTTELKFELGCNENNTLQLIHHGKKFGENNIWDSDAEGKQKCYLEINDIHFEGISGKDDILRNLEFVTHWTHEQLKGDQNFISQYSKFYSYGTMIFNGEIAIEFSTPIYNWLIDKKFKLPMKEVAYFSDYSSRWHYDEDLKLLNEIKEIIKYDKNRNN